MRGKPCPEAMSSQSRIPSLFISCNSDSDTRKTFPPLRQSHMLNVINVQCQLCVCVGSHLCAHGCDEGECRCWSEHICLHELSVEMTGILCMDHRDYFSWHMIPYVESLQTDHMSCLPDMHCLVKATQDFPCV